MDFVAIDFETANELPTSACELGLAVVRNYKVIETKSWLIRPPDLRFNPYNTKIHGISASDVCDMPKFDMLWNEIGQYLSNDFVIAHNAEFDMGVLKSLLHHYRIPFAEMQYTCSIKLARRAFSDARSFGLANLSRELGIKLNHHRAESDAEACAIIAAKAFRAFQVSFPHELTPRMNVSVQFLKPGDKPKTKRKKVLYNPTPRNRDRI